MKKQSAKILALIVLGLFLASLIAGVISAGPISESLSNFDLLEKIKPYVVPVGMEGWDGAIVGIIALLIVFSIMVDIVTLVAPFSNAVNWIIAIGLGIIMVLFKWNVTFAGWIVGLGGVAFGFAGAAAAALTIVMAIVALFFIFFGGLKLQKWITEIRGRRQILEAEKAGYKAAAAMVKGAKAFKEAGANI